MKKMLAWFVGIALTVGSLAIAGLFGIGLFLSPQNTLVQADAIVAISGGDTVARATEAIRLYKAGYSKLLVFSGAAQDSYGPSNAKVMESLALAGGVPPSDIVLDEAALNTSQNATGVASLLTGRSADTIILVTSPYHQRRASLLFHRALPRTRIINHSTTDKTWRRSAWWASDYSINLTLSELRKTLFVAFGGRS